MSAASGPAGAGGGGRPALELRGVRKRYGETVALAETSLRVEEGALLFLLGPSGCGKTTTLRLVAGFVAPDAGEIWIRGTRVDGWPPERRGLGMVFQHYALFPHMTVAQNVAFGLRMRRTPAAEAVDRIARALALVRLEGLEARYPRALSGGQQQRVALARALVVEPTLLLLDEPLSNLDLKLRVEMRGEIRALQRALGVTTVFVTHDQEEALTMADEVVVMNAGRIVQAGPPAALYQRPASRFVATFLGESNLLPATVTARLGPGRWRVDAGGLVLAGAGPGAWAPGDRVAVVVRPERIRLGLPAGAGAPGEPAPPEAAAGPGPDESFPANRVAGQVVETVFRGALRRYRIRLPQGAVLSVDEPVEGDGPACPPGVTVSARWRAEDCLLLPDD